MPNLTELSFSEIENIYREYINLGYPNIKSLEITNCRIDNLRLFFNQFPNLEYLKIHFKNLHYVSLEIEELRKKTYSFNLKQLKTLHLINKHASSLLFLFYNGNPDNYFSPSSLILENCHITSPSLFHKLTNLKSLTLKDIIVQYKDEEWRNDEFNTSFLLTKSLSHLEKLHIENCKCLIGSFLSGAYTRKDFCWSSTIFLTLPALKELFLTKSIINTLDFTIFLGSGNLQKVGLYSCQEKTKNTPFVTKETALNLFKNYPKIELFFN